MTDEERWWTSVLAAQFMAGEESVTQDLQPFAAAMAAEGRLADEMYLTQFAIDIDEPAEYAMDKIERRLGAIESARGRPVREIDVDASPETLEERFHAEDQAALATVA